jgi:hypothetical protein
MAKMRLSVTVSVRWWLPYYLSAVLMLCKISGREPNMDRVGQWIRRGLKVDC